MPTRTTRPPIREARTAGSRRAYRLPPSVPRRSAYCLGLPRLTDARPRLVSAPLPLQRGDPRLQASERRNLSLQPSEILPRPIPPFDLVHVSPPCRWDAALSHCPAGRNSFDGAVLSCATQLRCLSDEDGQGGSVSDAHGFDRVQ